MHRAFHAQRRLVELNMCPCGSCTQTSDLKLKFVAHVGEVATQTIKRRRKLVGMDVIFVHRLLKNPVPVPEYVLVSEDLYRERRHVFARASDAGDRAGPRGHRAGAHVLPGCRRHRRARSLRCRILPGRGASAARSAWSAGACRTCSAGAVRVTPRPRTDPSAAPASGSSRSPGHPAGVARRHARDPGDDLVARGRADRVPGHGGQEGWRCRTLTRRAASADARMVAVRGRSLSRAISPKPSPRSQRVDDASVADHLRTTGLDDVEAVAVLALLEHRLPRRELGVLEPGAELFDRRRRERAEHGDRPQDLDVRVADAHPRVEPAQRRPAGGHGERRQEADRDEREANAEHVDDERREQAADRDPERQDRLEAREHARQDGLVRQPGQHREAADVDQRVADADQAEQDDRRRLLGNDADQRQRRAEQRDPDAEPAGESATPDQPEREDRAEHAAGADRRVQDTDARISRVQQVDRDDDGEHGQAAARERLHHPEHRDQRQRAISRDGREAPGPCRGRARARRLARGGASYGSATTARPANSDAAAHAAKTAAGPLAASSTAAATGPPSVASESSMPRTAFALVRSCGDLASAGSRAECAGRYSATATVATMAKPYVAAGGPPVAVTAAAHAQHRGANDPDARPGPAHDEPGRPSSRGTARGAPRWPCGPP